LPFTPGKDAAGIVHSIGSDVKNVAVGDRVYIFGAITGSYAEYTLCSEENVFYLPDKVSFKKGACLGTPAFTAYRALFDKARGRPGDLVFVHGATGGVGLMAVQMARASGMRVVGTAGSEDGIEALLTAGAEAVYNHSDKSYVADIKTTYPNGFDICLEMLASSNLGIDLPLMAPKGRVAVIGSRGLVEINPRDLMSKELEVHGVALLQSTAADLKRAGSYINACLEQGTLDPQVSLLLPLEKANEAHVEVITRSKVRVGNIVLVPSLST
ncbi:CRYZ, partial [Symbiodinium microadriaticum]